MVNSSLRNSVARRNHKERAQPLHRQRLGLLEKHKDYVHRARDYKSKQDRIRKLREKAAFRNKDEFYWGMVKGRTKDGVVVANRRNEALGVDVVRLLKTQDVGYVRVQIAKDEKKIARLRAELEISSPGAGPSSEWDAAAELAEVETLAEMGVVISPDVEAMSRTRKGKGKSKAEALPNGHVVFVDERDQLESYGVQTEALPAASEPGPEESLDLGWEVPDPSPRKKGKVKAETEKKFVAGEIQEGAATEKDEVRTYPIPRAKTQTHRLTLLASLSALLARLRLLRLAEARLAATKSLMGKGGTARKVREAGYVEDESQPEDRNGERKRWEGKMWKWKLERKR